MVPWSRTFSYVCVLCGRHSYAGAKRCRCGCSRFASRENCIKLLPLVKEDFLK